MKAVTQPHSSSDEKLSGELEALKARITALETQVKKDQRPVPDVLPPKKGSSDRN
jgi:cell division protein FtsB